MYARPWEGQVTEVGLGLGGGGLICDFGSTFWFERSMKLIYRNMDKK